MCAYLSASPNPVEFSYREVQNDTARTVRVSWSAFVPRSRIVVRAGSTSLPVTGESTKVQDHPSGLFHASFPIRLGQTAQVSLLRPMFAVGSLRSSGLAALRCSARPPLSGSGGTPLAQVTVTTRKDPLAAYLTDPHPFVIRDLEVEPGVEEVTVRFTTTIATVGWVILRRKDDPTVVRDSMGTWFQLQHAHRIPLLDQGTTYLLTVVAVKMDAQGRITLGSGAGNPTIHGSVVTGTRSVHVEFNRLLVRNDSDPGGTGELSFGFGAGSVERQALYQPAHFYSNDDLGDGQIVDLGRHVTADRVSRWIWLQANGHDDDESIFSGGLGAVGAAPTFGAPGTHGDEGDDYDFAEVTQWIDTDALPAGHRTAVELATGDFALAFTVFGALTVTRSPGSVHLPQAQLRLRADTANHHRVAEYAAGNSIDIGHAVLAGPLLRLGTADEPVLLAADTVGTWWVQRPDGWSAICRATTTALARFPGEGADTLVIRTPTGQALVQSVRHGAAPEPDGWRDCERGASIAGRSEGRA